MSKLQAFISSTRSGGPFGVLVLAMVALAPTAMLGALFVAADLARPQMPTMDWRYYWSDSLVASPLFESALMFPVIWLLEKCRAKGEWVAVISALFWAIVHAARFPSQGILVFWPFWIFSKLILRWKPSSKNRAYLVTAAVHALFNLGMLSLEVLFWF